MINVTVKTNDLPRGKGYWKFNKTLLYDEKFVKNCNDIIEGYANKRWSEDKIWESCKAKVIKCAQKASRERALAKKERISLIKDKIEKLQLKSQEFPLDSNVHIELQNEKTKLEKYN